MAWTREEGIICRATHGRCREIEIAACPTAWLPCWGALDVMRGRWFLILPGSIQAAGVYWWCKPPTWAMAMTLPSHGVPLAGVAARSSPWPYAGLHPQLATACKLEGQLRLSPPLPCQLPSSTYPWSSSGFGSCLSGSTVSCRKQDRHEARSVREDGVPRADERLQETHPSLQQAPAWPCGSTWCRARFCPCRHGATGRERGRGC